MIFMSNTTTPTYDYCMDCDARVIVGECADYGGGSYMCGPCWDERADERAAWQKIGTDSGSTVAIGWWE